MSKERIKPFEEAGFWERRRRKKAVRKKLREEYKKTGGEKEYWKKAWREAEQLDKDSSLKEQRSKTERTRVAGKGTKGRWVTSKGKHIFIPEGAKK